jgi:hypothetical protein
MQNLVQTDQDLPPRQGEFEATQDWLNRLAATIAQQALRIRELGEKLGRFDKALLLQLAELKQPPAAS